MMISKTKAHKLILASLALALFSISAVGAEVANRFECLRDLLPLTERGAKLGKRAGFEPPFLLNNKYMVFAEVKANKVSGFFVYDHDHAWYYDSVEALSGSRTPIEQLRADRQVGVFELTAQPNGLETIAISHLPGFDPLATMHQGTAILGASVLPVVGAFIPHPKIHAFTYYDPSKVEEREIKAWFDRRESVATSRQPASVAQVSRTIARLATERKKTPVDLWEPLKNELNWRRDWIRANNIDEQTFRQLNKVMQMSCRPISN